MIRRALTLLVALVFAGIALPTGSALADVPGGQPNIVLILLDDLDQTTTPYWEVLTRTEQLLAERGLVFDRSFAPAPICCPSRAGLLTGKYPHNNGVFTNGGDYGGWGAFVQPLDEAGNPMRDRFGERLDNEEHTFAVHLEAAGYRTIMLGKYMNGLEHAKDHIPPGWSEWCVGVDNLLYTGYGYVLHELTGEGPSRMVRYGLREHDYQTDVLTRKTIDFLERAEQDDDRPFFVYLAPTAPHLPIPPARRHGEQAEQWRDQLPKPPNYFEEDLSDKPPWLRISGPKRSARLRVRWTDTDFRLRMGSLYAVDEMIESVVSTLEDLGELEHTYIFLTSDNGYNNGAHRLLHKMAPYEESIRVPLVVAGPRVEPGGVASEMALSIDLAPTFLELAGVAVPEDVDGRSLRSLLHPETEEEDWRSDFIVQYKSAGAANGIGADLPSWFWYRTLGSDIPTYRALRNGTHTFIEWYDGEEHFGLHYRELYDLADDPYQLENLLSTLGGRMRYRNLVDRYAARLEQLSHCAGESCR